MHLSSSTRTPKSSTDDLQLQAHKRQRRKAKAAHDAAQKHLRTNEPFSEAAFLEKMPVPPPDSPSVAVGMSATPRYMLGSPPGRFQNIMYMDVGGGRSKSPYNVFHIGILDGNHHCHPLHDTALLDCESKQAWSERLRVATTLVPLMTSNDARLVKDDHKGSDSAARDIVMSTL